MARMAPKPCLKGVLPRVPRRSQGLPWTPEATTALLQALAAALMANISIVGLNQVRGAGALATRILLARMRRPPTASPPVDP